MVRAGSRLDLVLDWFHPTRSAVRSDAGFATLNGNVDSDSRNFFVPEFGFNRMLRNDLSLGVSVYGHGGLNTNYAQGSFNCSAGPANMLCGNGRLGVDLLQLIVTPTMAYKVTPQHSIGASVLLGYQRFRAEGLQAFDNVTKIGVVYRATSSLVLRAGWNHGSNPVQGSDVTFNILAPGVVQDHATLGLTSDLGGGSELTFAAMVAPRKSTTGSSLFNGVLGAGAAGNERVPMRQRAFGLAWARWF